MYYDDYDYYIVITSDKEFKYKTRGKADNKIHECRRNKIKAKLIGYKNNKAVALLGYWVYKNNV